MTTGGNLTERQQKWFASIRDGLERDTGKSLGAWTAIARACPETKHRARLKWLKDHHGLLQNRASLVLNEAFGSSSAWSEPAALIDGLWTDPASRAIFEALSLAALALPGTLQTSRKGYTAWSRKVQFAAARPVKGGTARVSLAVPMGADARLEAARNEGGSERLTSRLTIASAADVDDRLEALLRAAWENA